MKDEGGGMKDEGGGMKDEGGGMRDEKAPAAQSPTARRAEFHPSSLRLHSLSVERACKPDSVRLSGADGHFSAATLARRVTLKVAS